MQRALGFASPSSAVFHLDKLVRLGLLRRTLNGQYQVTQRRKFGLMVRFFRVGWWWVPKHLVYALATTMVALAVLLLLFPLIGGLAGVALIPAAFSAVIQWYEAATLWRRRPRFREVAED